MIKIIYEGIGYDYGEVIGAQNYNIQTQVEMNKDASVLDIIEAIAKVMNIATYRVSVETIRQVCDELEEEYGGDRIM